ncbi:MAG: 2OG-Fe(II) oxygenase [Sphingomonas sp.]
MPVTSVVQAHQLLQARRVQDAAEVLRSAAEAGDASAAMELAVWLLRGDVVVRDLPSARAWLRRAVQIGHVDGALMEIALTANGSGGRADWTLALRRLQQAAKGDPIATQQLDLISTMRLAPDGNPRSLPDAERLSAAPLVRRFPAFITPAEAHHIAATVVAMLQPATVFDPANNRMVAHPIRSSDNAAIGPTQETLVIQAINRRIAVATGTQLTCGEPLTVLRYAPGQQYRPHLDTLSNTTNQRTTTAILYLSDDYRGGETIFPLLDLEVRARAGDLLVFDNVDATGAPDPRSRHAGNPVQTGTKWIATRWIRKDPISPWDLSDEARR